MAYMPLSFKENVSLKFLMNSTGVDIQNGNFVVEYEKKGAEILAKNNRIYTAALANLMDNEKFLEEMLKSYHSNYGLSYRTFANWFMTQIVKGLEAGRICMPNTFTDTLERVSQNIIEQNPAEANELFYLFNRKWVTHCVANSILNNLFSNIYGVGQNEEDAEKLGNFDIEKLNQWTNDIIDKVNQNNCDTSFVVLLTAAKAMRIPELKEQLLRAAANQIRKYYLKEEDNWYVNKEDMVYIENVLLDGLRNFVNVGGSGDFWRLHDSDQNISVPNVVAAYEKFNCNPFGLEYPINIKDVQSVSYDEYEYALAACIAADIEKEEAVLKKNLYNNPEIRREVIESYEGSSMEDYEKDAIALAASLTPEEVSAFVLESNEYEVGIPYLAYNLDWLPDTQLTDTGVDKNDVLTHLHKQKEKTSKAEEEFYYRMEVAKNVQNRNETLAKARERYNNLNPLRRAWISAVYNIYKNSGPVTNSPEFENLHSGRAEDLYYKLGKK